MKNVKLMWELRQWKPGLTTLRRPGRSVVVFFSESGHRTVDSGFSISHRAAAQWAAVLVGDSIERMVRS